MTAASMICYNESKYVKAHGGPCGSWCTHALGTAPGCGSDTNHLCSNASCPGAAAGNNTVVHVFKFPQNAAGWARLTVDDCPAGTAITMYFAEVLCGHGTTKWSTRCPLGQLPGGGITGTVDQRNMVSACRQRMPPPVSHACRQYFGSALNLSSRIEIELRVYQGPVGGKHDTYICKGKGTEVYEPRFTYVGHRFVEVHNFPGTPTAASLQQRVVHSDVEAAPAALAGQTAPRRLAGSIAFGGGKSEAAPSSNGEQCYEGEGCHAARPGPAAPAVLDQIAHNVRWCKTRESSPNAVLHILHCF